MTNKAFIIIVLLIGTLAYVDLYVGLILSIALAVFVAAFLYINQDDFN